MKNIVAIRLLLLANFISGIAQGISMISIPAYFAQSGQSNWFNIAYATITIGSLFWSLYAGTLIDKYNRKHIFLALNIVNGIAIGTIAYLEYNEIVRTPILAASVFALTFWNYNLHYPCFYAFMQEISERKHYNKIASYIEIQSQMATALAGATAALLIGGGIHTTWFSIAIEPWSLYQIFALDATTYFIALTIIYSIQYIPMTERSEETGSVWTRLKTGYQYLCDRPYVFLFGAVTHAVFIVTLLHVFNLAPLYVAQTLEQSSQVFAISELFYAMGAITAGVAIHRIFGGMTFAKAIVIMMFISGLEMVGLIAVQSVWFFYGISLLLGLTNAGIRVIRVSYLFQVLPNQVIGRANSIFFITNILARIFFLSLFSLAFFHQSGQVVYAFLILSGFIFISMGILLFFYQKIVAVREG
ncbi:MAG: MFS transporter [Aureispira sp.]